MPVAPILGAPAPVRHRHDEDDGFLDAVDDAEGELANLELPGASAVDRPSLGGLHYERKRTLHLSVEVFGRLFASGGVERLGFAKLALRLRMESNADGVGHAWP